ncbi:MAG: glycosyltransferase family 2 protein, partial [Candidatus Eremiobacteraeota bacterium]|nr:glycosyltransferase family 2 protein [Candidatus Eremiobacteraeota bacterium]
NLNTADITVVVLTKNEEANLGRTLESIPSGCSVLVVDARSTDRTAEIAHAHGATVVLREWRGFLDARLFALGQVRTGWTFMLDADEALDQTLRNEIVAANVDAIAGFVVTRATFFCGKVLRQWSREKFLRIFGTDRVTLASHPIIGGADVQIHERWQTKGTVRELSGFLMHYSYPTVASYRSKFETYTSLEAQSRHAKAGRISATVPAAVLRFLHTTLFRGGLKDGWRGVYVAFWSAMYPVVVARKIRHHA